MADAQRGPAETTRAGRVFIEPRHNNTGRKAGRQSSETEGANDAGCSLYLLWSRRHSSRNLPVCGFAWICIRAQHTVAEHEYADRETKLCGWGGAGGGIAFLVLAHEFSDFVLRLARVVFGVKGLFLCERDRVDEKVR